jgi:hypothetical protein
MWTPFLLRTVAASKKTGRGICRAPESFQIKMNSL